ncbi:hypothetical protein ACV3ZD_00470 [Clostridium perfringens]
MFLDLFDTIKTSEIYYEKEFCEINAISGEIMLYYLILSGKTPVLTQTQAMDSTIIHSILNEEKNTKYFLELLRNNNIKLALYNGNGARSLQDYFKKALSYGIDGETDFFEFSSMPFLNEYDKNLRKKFNKHIIDSIEHNYYNFKFDGIKSEDIEKLEAIVNNIQHMDRAIKGEYITSNIYRKNLDDLFLNHCNSIIRSSVEENEFIDLCKRMKSKNYYGNRRSAYYSFIDELKEEGYKKENIRKIRQVVDNCYNEASSSLISNSSYSLNFSSEYGDLINSVQENGKLEKKELIEIKNIESNKYLTWERINSIIKEVKAIEKNKKITYLEALNEFKRRQPINMVVSVARYIGISTLSTFIPGVPNVFEVGSELVSGAISDLVCEKLKKPSITDTINELKEESIKRKLTQNTIEFISMSMK